MEIPIHIRYCLLYEFKSGLNASAAARRIQQAFGEGCVAERTAREWFARFRSGDESVQDKPRSGRPSTVDNDRLRTVVESDPRQTLSEIANSLTCSRSTALEHLRAIGKVRKLNKWVPHKLSEQNKIDRATICKSLMDRNQNEPFLDRILTADEKWILYDNVRRCYQWVDPDDAPGLTEKPGLHPKKILLCIWWTTSGIVHYELLKAGQTITASVYCSQLEKVQQVLKKKQPSLVNRKRVAYLHDNARPHVARETHQKLTDLGWEVLPHPPYSPDVAPTDYHLFRSLDNFMRGKSCSDRNSMESALNEYFSQKNNQFFREGIYKLPDRWRKVVECEGNYFNE